MKLRPILILLTLLASILGSPTTILAKAKKPNILVIMGDDIGWYNPSIYHRGDMGYSTPARSNRSLPRSGARARLSWSSERQDQKEGEPDNEVRVFGDRKDAAQWLGVPLEWLAAKAGSGETSLR